MRAGAQGVLLKLLFLDNIEHCQPDGAGDGVAAEGIEVLHAIVERSGDFGRRHYCGKGMPVADGLAQGDDIGDDALRLEAPEVRANASKTYLHFVCNAAAARGSGLSSIAAATARLQTVQVCTMSPKSITQ